MAFELPALPYAKHALEPYISEETLNYHYGKHHQAYVNKLNDLVPGTEFANASLEDIIMNAEGGVFNNGAQIWNHTFYWHSMTPNATEPDSAFLAEIEKHFGSLDSFKEQFTNAAMTRFGSGWAWLVKNSDGALEIVSTGNADNPMRDGKTPLLTCDVWEHAYYIDTRNDRGKYVSNFWAIVNWQFAADNFAK